MEQSMAYLDNAATTRVCEEAAQAAMNMMTHSFGNPSSLHKLGVASSRQLSTAREAVASIIGCQSECIFFTSGGSESNNLAIFGAANAKKRQGREIITTSVEHSSVSSAMKRLEDSGWTITRIQPNQDGTIDARTVADAVTERTALVSVMMVNNETGAIFPIEKAAKLIRAKNPKTLIHCDGVQAFGKLPLKVARWDIDLMSISGHKICAPKGSGALYIRRGVRILPLIYGGGQEKGLRSGTESVPMIAALGAACQKLNGHIKENYDHAAGLKAYLVKKLSEIEQVCINSPENGSPYICSFSVPGYRSETMLHFLESRGVFVSSGSACSKGAVSPVLTSMGLPKSITDSALRVSTIYHTQEQEIDQLIDALKDGIDSVAHRS